MGRAGIIAMLECLNGNPCDDSSLSCPGCLFRSDRCCPGCLRGPWPEEPAECRIPGGVPDWRALPADPRVGADRCCVAGAACAEPPAIDSRGAIRSRGIVVLGQPVPAYANGYWQAGHHHPHRRYGLSRRVVLSVAGRLESAPLTAG